MSMKKFYVLLLVTLGLLVITSDIYSQTKWKFVVSGKDSDWYLAIGSEQYKSNNVIFWVKNTSVDKKFDEDLNGYLTFKLVKVEIDCSYNEFRAVTSIKYSQKGDFYIDDTPSKFTTIPVGSVIEEFYKILCK